MRNGFGFKGLALTARNSEGYFMGCGELELVTVKAAVSPADEGV